MQRHNLIPYRSSRSLVS